MKFLVTSIGSLSAEAVINGIRRYSESSVVGVNVYPASWTAASRLVDEFFQVAPAINRDEYVSNLIEICRLNEITHLVPLTDVEVDVISSCYEIFASIGITPCISSRETNYLARDKFNLHQRYLRHPSIKTIPTLQFRDVDKYALQFPALAKPRLGRSSEGHLRIPDIEALEFWSPRLNGENYIIQPHFQGEVIVVDIVRSPINSACAAVARRELLRTQNGAGLSVEVFSEHPCIRLAELIAIDIELIGCNNIEFLIVEGRSFLMDINPRFSAGVSFSISSGYDMVMNHIRCFADVNIDLPTGIKNSVYCRGFVEYNLS